MKNSRTCISLIDSILECHLQRNHDGPPWFGLQVMKFFRVFGGEKLRQFTKCNQFEQPEALALLLEFIVFAPTHKIHDCSCGQARPSECATLRL